MNGIYSYIDKKDNNIVYIGKDNKIDENKRYKDHLQPSNYYKQPFNRVLQNNPDRYEYKVLKSGDFKENLLNALEIIYIRRYSPKFNFTVGGDGSTGYKHSKKTKMKMSKTHMGVSHPSKGKKRKPISKEHKLKISNSKRGKFNKYSTINKNGNDMYGKQNYCIYRRRKIIKQSIYPSKLLDWFTSEFPKEILQIKINMEVKK